MVETVQECQLAAIGERGHDAEVCHIACRKQQCALASGEGSKLLLELLMLDAVAGDEMRRSAPRAETGRAGTHRRCNGWVMRKPEVVVAAEVNERSPVRRRDESIPGLDETIDRDAPTRQGLPIDVS